MGVKSIIDDLYQTIGIRLNIDDDLVDKALGMNNMIELISLCSIITNHMELPILIVPEISNNYCSEDMVHNEAGSTAGVAAKFQFLVIYLHMVLV
jgi:hypothetical protein